METVEKDFKKPRTKKTASSSNVADSVPPEKKPRKKKSNEKDTIDANVNTKQATEKGKKRRKSKVEKTVEEPLKRNNIDDDDNASKPKAKKQKLNKKDRTDVETFITKSSSSQKKPTKVKGEVVVAAAEIKTKEKKRKSITKKNAVNGIGVNSVDNTVGDNDGEKTNMSTLLEESASIVEQQKKCEQKQCAQLYIHQTQTNNACDENSLVYG